MPQRRSAGWYIATAYEKGSNALLILGIGVAVGVLTRHSSLGNKVEALALVAALHSFWLSYKDVKAADEKDRAWLYAAEAERKAISPSTL